MFRKNTSGQFIGVQLLLTADGAIATGLSPTVRRCIDGTFAAADGTVTEDTGTGFYKYAMSQADTNGNNIQFRFTATGAIPVCVNIVTTVLNPYDTVRAGLTALPNAAADAAGGLPISDAGGLDLDAKVGALTYTVANRVDAQVLGIANNAITANSINADAITAAKVADGAIDATTFAAGAINAAAVADGAIDAATFAAGAINAAAIADGAIDAGTFATGAIDAAAISADAGAELADAFLNRDMATGTDSGSTTVRTPRQALRFLRNKWSTSGIDATTATLTVTKEDDSTTSWTGVVTSDSAAHPIIANDPAGP